MEVPSCRMAIPASRSSAASVVSYVVMYEYDHNSPFPVEMCFRLGLVET